MGRATLMLYAEAILIAAAAATALLGWANWPRTFVGGGEGFGVRIKMLDGPGGGKGAGLLVGEGVSLGLDMKMFPN